MEDAMALFHRQFSLASTPPFQPLAQPQLVPLPPIGVHVTYAEYYRKPIKPGEIESRFLIGSRMSYQDGSVSVVAEPSVGDLPYGLGRLATMAVQKTIDSGDTLFTLLVPNVVPRAGEVEAIATVG